MKGQHQFKKPDGSPDGVGHFHFQITATGLDAVNTNSEAELFQKIPDIDMLEGHLNASDTHVVITLRGIGLPTSLTNSIGLSSSLTGSSACFFRPGRGLPPFPDDSPV